jgi:tetrapyrrole methylase family protein/MazG family protein
MDTPRGASAALDDFVGLIARLRAPGGCPWDREQTHASLKPMTIEEAYEVLVAIDEGTDEDLAGELGDLLLQVVFHSQIAAEEGRFTIADVIARVSAKMVRRHPHVFGDETAATPGEVLRNWEALKREERAKSGKAAPAESMLDSVPHSLPAVMEAFQATTKVGRVGFDWPGAGEALDKLEEEVRELRQEASASPRNPRRVSEEVGDLLLTVVNVARILGVDPESALKSANRKFRRRFGHVESRLRERGRGPAESSLDEMEALWKEAKAAEARSER